VIALVEGYALGAGRDRARLRPHGGGPTMLGFLVSGITPHLIADDGGLLRWASVPAIRPLNGPSAAS
jgi:hypothetical protein